MYDMISDFGRDVSYMDKLFQYWYKTKKHWHAQSLGSKNVAARWSVRRFGPDVLESGFALPEDDGPAGRDGGGQKNTRSTREPV